MMQCRHCWTPVKERDRSGKTWGMGENEDKRNWVHASTVNANGNPACSRTFLSEEDLEEADSDTTADGEDQVPV